MTINQVLYKLIGNTLLDFISHADSDQATDVKARCKDIGGAILYDNMYKLQLTNEQKLRILYRCGLKEHLKIRNGVLKTKDLNEEFYTFIYFMAERKLVKLGYLEPDPEF